MERRAISGKKTFWHLGGAQRKPTDYEIATTRLLYYPQRGFEVRLPLGEWYERHQRGTRLRCGDWDRFSDPRETTYARYTELQAAKQMFVDGLFRSVDAAYDRSLSPEWVELLARLLAPMRFPAHGLQMISAYTGHMAPGGRLVVASLFQTADEMRRIQIVAYRTRQLQKTYPGFGDNSRSVWEQDPAWQPWREMVERLLVTYDWDEAFVALHLVLKPSFDDVFVDRLGRVARARGDDVLARLLFSIREDCEWHRAWARAAVDLAIAEDEDNGRAVDGWVERWRPLATRAVAGLAELLG